MTPLALYIPALGLGKIIWEIHLEPLFSVSAS